MKWCVFRNFIFVPFLEAVGTRDTPFCCAFIHIVTG